MPKGAPPMAATNSSGLYREVLPRLFELPRDRRAFGARHFIDPPEEF